MNAEQEQFEALFRDTRAPLLAYLTRRAPSDDAVDLLAELYLVAWRKRAELPPGDERRLWLYGVARRLLAQHRRSTLAWAQAHDAAAEAGTADSPDDDDRRSEVVREALQSLSDVDRELITLTAWDGLSTADAARVVGITAGTARVRLHRARARLARHPRLRALLDPSDPDGRSAAPSSAAQPEPMTERTTLLLAVES